MANKSHRKQEDTKRKPGPAPETVKIDHDWEDAVEDALKKKRPEEGWPDRRKDDDE